MIIITELGIHECWEIFEKSGRAKENLVVILLCLKSLSNLDIFTVWVKQNAWIQIVDVIKYSDGSRFTFRKLQPLPLYFHSVQKFIFYPSINNTNVIFQNFFNYLREWGLQTAPEFIHSFTPSILSFSMRKVLHTNHVSSTVL